jgi:hypothetical protein
MEGSEGVAMGMEGIMDGGQRRLMTVEESIMLR